MAFPLDDITGIIQQYDNSFSGDYSSINVDAMKRAAWLTACNSVETEEPNKVDSITISNGAISGTDSDWGLDHFKPNFRATLLNGTSLVPYKSTKEGFKKYIVINNTKIHKFTTNSNAFEAAKGAVKYYGAANYFNQVSDNTNEVNSTGAGNNYVNNYNYQTD